MKTIIAGLFIVGFIPLIGAYDIPENPDRKISFGLNYDHTGQNSDYTFRNFTQSDFTKVTGNDIMADIKIPLSAWFTFQVRGGYLSQSNDIFTGEKVDYKGYDIGVGIRFYIQ